MQTTSSFLGKCATVLVGMGLSWLTMTNPQAEQLARQFFGPHEATASDSATQDLAQLDVSSPRVLAETASESIAPAKMAVGPTASPLSEEQRLHELSDMLKELGATYLRVERLVQSGETWFRVRCDLAHSSDQVKCCLESTRGSAIAAMEDVLQRAAGYGMVRPRGEPAAI